MNISLFKIFSPPEVENQKFQQKKVFEKTRQIARAIPGYILAASTIVCAHDLKFCRIK